MSIPIDANIKICLAVKNLAELRAVVSYLQGQGINPTATVTDATTEKPVATAPPEKEKGPMEKEFLDRAGLERMRVPSDWKGSREEYAAHRLHGMNFPSQAVAVEGESDGPSESVTVEVGEISDAATAWNLEDLED